MVDHIDLALRRFERLRLFSNDRLGEGQAQELSLWLEQDVGVVVEDLVERPDFQSAARWPLDHLRPGAPAEERRLVDAVDADLINWAMQLSECSRGSVVEETSLRPEATGAISFSGAPESPEPIGAEPDAFHAGLRAVDYIARRPWRDLVALSDYFGPTSDLNLRDREHWLGPNSRQVQVGEFVPCFNPSLSAPGDFVSRTLLTRVGYWQHVLQKFESICRMRTANRPRGRDGSWKAVDAACSSLREHAEQLRDRCLFGREAKVRNACIALLQVYADYRPRVSLGWLGVPPLRRPLGLRQRVERHYDGSVGEKVAAALLDVAALYRSAVDVSSLIEAKTRRHPLVVVMGHGRRETYWQGELVPADWVSYEAVWQFWSALVEQVKSGQGVDAFDQDRGGRGSVKDRRHRLKSLLPPTLDERVQSTGRGTYRLALSADEVCLLHFAEEERLTERDAR